jgi:hypothetical protein
MHWTEMPVEFSRNLEKYKKEDAIVFRQLDYFGIWVLLMLKDYNRLSKYYVDLNLENSRSRNEIIELLRSRTKRSF